jgi:hypothetical protein
MILIPFVNRKDEKWPHTRQIKISGRNHILPPLGIAWKTNHRQWTFAYYIGCIKKNATSDPEFPKKSLCNSEA